MKKSGLTLALLALGSAAALRLAAPGLPRLAREALGLPPEDGAVTAFRALGERLAAGGQPRRETPPAGEEPLPETPPPFALYAVEEAAVLGEFAPEAEEPPAVAAFLERQAAFSDYARPENVEYGYETLPFDYASPVEGVTSSGFGFRVHPIENEVRFHYGTDFAAGAGTDVTAFADGTVRVSEASDSFGNYVVVDHGGGWSSLYAHCSYLFAEAGRHVARGERIALVGATGHVTGPHLHFELRRDGIYRNPEYYLDPECALN